MPLAEAQGQQRAAALAGDGRGCGRGGGNGPRDLAGGAVGTLRSQDPVELEPTNEGDTRVQLSSDLAVGGILGALGHKVTVSKSREITEKFARALQAEIQSATVPGA